MKSLTIVKIGGNIVDDVHETEYFLSLAAEYLQPCIIIHGGGKIATELSSKLGVATTMVEGRRITDKATLDIATMVYGGLVNKSLVAKVQALGINALGVTGADGNSILSEKRPVRDIDYGFVGDIIAVNAGFFLDCLDNALMPIVAPLTHDGKGTLLNTNADTIAAQLAIALAPHRDISLLYCFEKKGVLSDMNNEESVITELHEKYYRELVEQGHIHKGMKPKCDNAFMAKKHGVQSVAIVHARQAHRPQSGTTIII